MNVTENVIADLYPLYVSQECSADTRVLVEGYLQQHPEIDRRLRRIMSAGIATHAASIQPPDEMAALRKARRSVRGQSWLMALAIFFSFCPLSVVFSNGDTRWMVAEAPGTAFALGTVGLVLWLIYAVVRYRSRVL
jgi:hypothetical protein